MGTKKPLMKRGLFAILAMILAVFSMTVMTATSYAAETTNGTSMQAQKAQSELRSYAVKSLGANQYEVEGGGYAQGTELFSNDSGTIDVNTDEYNKLSKKGQSEFTKDLIGSMNTASEGSKQTKAANGTPNVTTSTAQNWLKSLQQNPGMGTKILQETLAQTRPDFVEAQKIYAPFSGAVGVIIAVIAILLMAGLVLTMVIDIAYITLPFLRGMGADGEGKGNKIKFVSHEAIAAVKETEEGDGKGTAIFAYLKKRFVGIILLTLTLVMLVSGQVFNVAGSVVDLGLGIFS